MGSGGPEELEVLACRAPYVLVSQYCMSVDPKVCPLVPWSCPCCCSPGPWVLSSGLELVVLDPAAVVCCSLGSWVL